MSGRRGTRPEAHHIPLGDLEARYQELPSDATIVCVCRGGGRSARAAAALSTVGLSAINLAGGMRAWESAGLPVVADDGDRNRHLSSAVVAGAPTSQCRLCGLCGKVQHAESRFASLTM